MAAGKLAVVGSSEGQGTHEDAGGAEGERLEDVGAAADAAVEVHRDAPLGRRHDLRCVSTNKQQQLCHHLASCFRRRSR